MITKGFLDRFFHGASYLRPLFQRNHFRTVYNEMDFILIEMHFMVVPYLFKILISVQDETGIYLAQNFSNSPIQL